MKKWFTSKTLAISAITGVLSFLGFLQGQEFITQNPATVSILGMFVSALTAYIRFRTKDKITL